MMDVPGHRAGDAMVMAHQPMKSREHTRQRTFPKICDLDLSMLVWYFPEN
jgi:hypothetical protein